MKRAVLLLFALAWCAVSGAQEKQILELLKREFPAIQFKVENISEPMRLYTPFELLNSMKLRLAEDGYSEGLARDLAKLKVSLEDLERFTRASLKKAHVNASRQT